MILNKENLYFEKEMQELLKDDYKRFLASFDLPLRKALRINRLKANKEQIEQEINLLEKVSFDDDTYYVANDNTKLGNHPFHLSGLYYLQEPSATMAVNALDIQPGNWVLDLCAAPGGKSTHILSKLNNTGFLLSNEYDKKRANTLLSNLERWGGENYLLTNSSTDKLCPGLKGMFDRVLVDAPCSGASMFKKYPETIDEYTPGNVKACCKRQLMILRDSYQTLKNGGVLVYSTCTYNIHENEEVIEQFLNEFPNMHLVETGLSCGQAGFDEKGLTRRVFPFEDGEGHFVCKMVKKGEETQVRIKTLPFSRNKLVDKFLSDNYLEELNYTIINNKIYVSKQPLLDLKVNILRQGILLGEIVNNRVEPHHHFFLTYKAFKNVYDISEPKELADYLCGLSLMVKGFKGYVQIRYLNVPIGFGKGDGMQIKNHLPKGLRHS